MTPLLRIAGLTKQFGPVPALAGPALADINLDVAPGEIFVLLGASGSGKTTLLRCIGGFERQDAGTITLDGADISTLPPHLRPVNMMFQSLALFPHMDVAANIGFGLRQAGMARAETARVVEGLLGLVQLPGFGARRVDALSGGQRQRVALARALARQPHLLLLDEPLSALDRGLREEMRGELLRVQRTLRTAFVLVTHDQEEALAIGHRIGVMQEGRLAQVGTPEDVFERPANRFVADFFGMANFLSATVRERGRGFSLVRLALGNLPVRVATAAPLGAKVELGIRPERLRLDGDGPNTLEGTVRAIIYRGAALDVWLVLEDGTPLLVRHPTGGGVPEVGTPTKISFPADVATVLVA